ncbi:MAG: alpha/beta hydrolase [Treponema sp.]|nr:alpha/beta hydrolase [Treponema sp.]MBO6219584.1 alpha/beta hydrolase [Treponema sp.]
MKKSNMKFSIMLLGVLVMNMAGCANLKLGTDEKAKGLENTRKLGIEINGELNGMFITCTNENNPVLLFISGGPGVPEVWLNDVYKDRYPNKLAEHFTVCYWDYYGEGLSYNKKIKAEDITLERLTADAITVAKYLREKFHKEKIYLMAHSSGTNLGLHLAQSDSEDFYCYFGMGQNYSDDVKRFEAAYDFLKSEFEKTGNKKGLKKLEKLAEISDEGKITIKKPKSIGRDMEKVLLMAGCATTREMRSDAKDIFFKQLSAKCYTTQEKINYWKGKKLLSKSPYRSFYAGDHADKRALIPLIFLSGYYDYTTPIPLSKQLLDKLEAPEKSFYTFNNSAHSPLWEENDLVIEAMLRHVR